MPPGPQGGEAVGPADGNPHRDLWSPPHPPKLSPVPSPVLRLPCLDLPPPPALVLPHPPNLLFKILSLEGEQEPAHVVLAQLIDAAGIDGTAQELVYLILRVQGILSSPAEGRGHGFTRCMSMAVERPSKGKDTGSTQTECEPSVWHLLSHKTSRGPSAPHNPVPGANAVPTCSSSVIQLTCLCWNHQCPRERDRVCK